MNKDGRDERKKNYPELIKLPTRWMDNDVYGHVNNVVSVSYTHLTLPTNREV